jgi:hypothetical protein
VGKNNGSPARSIHNAREFTGRGRQHIYGVAFSRKSALSLTPNSMYKNKRRKSIWKR